MWSQVQQPQLWSFGFHKQETLRETLRKCKPVFNGGLEKGAGSSWVNKHKLIQKHPNVHKKGQKSRKEMPWRVTHECSLWTIPFQPRERKGSFSAALSHPWLQPFSQPPLLHSINLLIPPLQGIKLLITAAGSRLGLEEQQCSAPLWGGSAGIPSLGPGWWGQVSLLWDAALISFFYV